MPANGQEPNLPGPKDRLAVIGTTGSGKTVAALWHLSRTDIDRKPWVVFDFKDDEGIAGIENAQHVELNSPIIMKAKSGLFVVHPMRGEDQKVNEQMQRILAHGNIGIYVDEPDLNQAMGFEDVLRKGRSHRIPVIALTQRPVDCNRYMLSEAGYYQIFDLADEKDWSRVRNFVPLHRFGYEDDDPALEKYHSLYYERDRKKLTQFAPVPKVDRILGDIDAKLVPNRKHIFV
jgi:hypothetical protein